MRHAATLLVFAALAAARVEAAPACAAGPTPLIDVHLHAYDDTDPRLGTPNPATGAPPPTRARDGAGHAAATLAELARLNVERAVVSGGSAPPRRLAVEAMAASSNGRVRFGYEVSGNPTAGDLAAIRRFAAAGKLAYIGEFEPAYDGVAFDDPRLEPVWALAEALDVPVAVHSGSGPPDAWRSMPANSVVAGDPIKLEPVLRRHPRLRIVLLHMGYPFADHTIALMTAYSSVHAETGAIDWLVERAGFHTYLNRLVDAGFGKRVIFGSDQMAWPDGIGLALDAVAADTRLSSQQRRDLLHDNAVRFFRWTDLAVCDEAAK